MPDQTPDKPSGEIFKTAVKVRFADCDPAGIVFYPRYFEMINGVVEDWLAQALDWSFPHMLGERNEGLPTVNIECQFIRTCRMGDVLDFELSVAALGKSSCTVNIAAFHNTAAVLRGTHVLVYVAHSGQHRSLEIPPPLRRRMAAFIAATPAEAQP
ncbi:acyl-CoA thioesterase [Exilibacterium tricleocarpae]|uniref:Acyl-CoA thioesterase n=1 Tax=Exilibacterium tricleocarpae TaxID=2591008 RepID=A0A545ST27_9GAMM|nr:acyl-CoA thioesterase [Exilibacterium tricleocarpae]TQV68121.1 acyl-CoA thioesterase [Exilibacterium tricleocarpae]